MAKLTLPQELSEIRSRLRNFGRKVKDAVDHPIYYSDLRELNKCFGEADNLLSQAEIRLKEYLNDNDA